MQNAPDEVSHENDLTKELLDGHEQNLKHHDDEDREKKIALGETQMLENSLNKLGALMALGYGEAGSHMIAENMA